MNIININDWNTARTTVNIRVYCDNFLLPASPSSFCNFSSEGITTEISWTMIEDVINGPMPNAKIDTLPSAPPETNPKSDYIITLRNVAENRIVYTV